MDHAKNGKIIQLKKILLQRNTDHNKLSSFVHSISIDRRKRSLKISSEIAQHHIRNEFDLCVYFNPYNVTIFASINENQ